MAIDLPAIKIVNTTPPHLFGGAAAVEERLTVKPVAPGVWIEQFQLLIDGIDRTTVMGKRNYAMLRLLWDNALRRAEVCGLDRR